jgi:hypothetical protein
VVPVGVGGEDQIGLLVVGPLVGVDVDGLVSRLELPAGVAQPFELHIFTDI